jgi:hypothetical protein
VAGVAEEPPHLLLAGVDPGQHAVQGRAKPAHLGPGIVRGHAMGEVAAADPFGLPGHRLDRAQPTAHDDEDAEADEQNHRDRPEGDDKPDLVAGLCDLLEAGTDDQEACTNTGRKDAKGSRIPELHGVRAVPGEKRGDHGSRHDQRAHARGPGPYFKPHCGAAGGHEGDIKIAGECGDLEVGRSGPGGRLAGTRRLPGRARNPLAYQRAERRLGHGERHPQVVVGLGEQITAHGDDHAYVEHREGEQRDNHDTGHHLEAQRGVQQSAGQGRRAGNSATTHRNSPGFRPG